MNHVIDFK